MELVDFMPFGLEGSHIIRLLHGISGRVTVSSKLVLRFGYGSAVPWVEKLEDGTIRAICGPEMVLLRSPVPHHGEDRTITAEFTVQAGDTIPLMLSYCPSHHELGHWPEAEQMLHETGAAWRAWSSRCAPAGRYSEVVKQSLLVLKGLTYKPTGGIVAAATTSLPEQPGGVRNWDYRYCWLRDATFTLLALGEARYDDEARAWRDRLCALGRIRCAMICGSSGSQVRTSVGRRFCDRPIIQYPCMKEPDDMDVPSGGCLAFGLAVYYAVNTSCSRFN